MRSLLLCYLTLKIITLVTAAEKKAGRWDVEITQIEHCEEGSVDENVFYLNSSKITKVGKNKFRYTSELTTTKEMTNNQKLHVNIHSFGNGGYKPNFMELDFNNSCDTVRNYIPDFFNALLRAINKTDCPYPPGVYYIKDVPFEGIGNLPSVPVFEYGKYRMRIEIIDEKDRKIGCMYGYFNIVPKKKEAKKKNRQQKNINKVWPIRKNI